MIHRAALLVCLLGSSIAVAADPPATRPAAVHNPLTMPRPAAFAVDAAPLAQAIELFRSTTGASVYVNWRSIEAIGIDRDTPVTWPGERPGNKANTMGDAL